MPLLDMPCLKPEGLAVFTQTPEQRLLLGVEWFDITHVPMHLRKYIGGKPRSVSENELLIQLQNGQRYIGNRVFALYGAAGSGKSELMTWLEQGFVQIQPDRPLIRIARTELDILSVINRLRHLLTGDYFSEVTIQRWEEMRRKPRTLSKLLVLRALERLVSSDDLINALFYRLIDVVEPQITLVLERTAGREALDLILRDNFDAVRLDIPDALPFAFEVFRQHLLDGFRELMLENISIRDTLIALSQHFARHHQRPILLIDDLVQSMNLFATEFLDYFITLDQGNWDVMIGITPASFQYDSRGRELLDRINHLDTIDDRVDKLWLSDEQGLESFFVSESNCVALAFAYLDAFRRLNMNPCTLCPARIRCQSLQHSDSLLLAPFNEASIVRLFRSLPPGKGKVRAFIAALRQVLEIVVDGGAPTDALAAHAQSELYVESDASVSELIKWYGQRDMVDDVAHILDFFAIPYPSSLSITTLNFEPKDTTALDTEPIAEDDYTRLAVRDWLEGREVNRQLLQKLRKGIAFWLRGVQIPISLTAFHYPHCARPNRVLRDMWMEMDTTPPIALEGVDAFYGIEISRSLGHLAFLFANLGDLGGRAHPTIDRKLAQDPRALALIWQAEAFAERRQGVLESQLGMPLEDFALLLYILRLLLNDAPPVAPDGVPTDLLKTVQATHEYLHFFVAPLPARTSGSIDKLFDDFFKLRDNVYDTPRMMERLQGVSIEATAQRLSAMSSTRVDETFCLGSLTLHDFIQRICVKAEEVVVALGNASPSVILNLSSHGRDVLHRLQKGAGVPLQELSPTGWRDFDQHTPDVYRRMQVFLTHESD